jgi:hypothetical protein
MAAPRRSPARGVLVGEAVRAVGVLARDDPCDRPGDIARRSRSRWRESCVELDGVAAIAGPVRKEIPWRP